MKLYKGGFAESYTGRTLALIKKSLGLTPMINHVLCICFPGTKIAQILSASFFSSYIEMEQHLIDKLSVFYIRQNY